MLSCKEFELDDLLAITAVPIEDYTYWSEMVFMPVIRSIDFSLPVTNAIVIGKQPATSSGDLIPIIRFTGKAKDSESDSVAGRKHAVEVNCNVDNRDSESWTLLRTLEQTPRHLLLNFRNNTQGFVAATEDTYLCNVEHDGAKTSVSFRIENISGIQFID